MGVSYSNGSHVTWRTIQTPNILDHKQVFSVRFLVWQEENQVELFFALKDNNPLSTDNDNVLVRGKLLLVTLMKKFQFQKGDLNSEHLNNELSLFRYSDVW